MNIRTIVVAIAAATVVAIGSYGVTRSKSTQSVVDMRGASEVSIVLTDEGFTPRYVRVTSGTKITFTTTRANQFWPASNEHPTHSIYPEFDSKQQIEPGSSWSVVLSRKGEWSYHDHLRSYFIGRIYVD